MDNKQNRNVLDEVNKGTCMGMDAIKDIIPKTDDDTFKEILNGEYEKYNKIHDRIEAIYDEFSSKDEPTETSVANKVMTSMMVDMKTITDSSVSKLSELLIQGTNMGIIEGRKLINHKNKLDSRVKKILSDFVSMQEESVETLKRYL